MILFLLIVTATFRPLTPTVGDLITIEFQHPVVLEKSNEYEVVAHHGNRVVVRTFRPGPIEIAGRVGDVQFRRLMVPVGSVLQPDDTMEPAPLKPPLAPPASQRPQNAMIIAAAVAALAWLAAIALARRLNRPVVTTPQLSPAERFRSTIAELRRDRARPDRWAALADATRSYLAETQSTLGAEQTTAEMLRSIRKTSVGSQEVVVAILRQGDLEKFSPWGAVPGDFDALAARALELVPPSAVEEAA